MTDVPQLPGQVTDSIGRVTERSPSAAIAMTAIVSISVVLGVIIWKLLDDQEKADARRYELTRLMYEQSQVRLTYILRNYEPRDKRPDE